MERGKRKEKGVQMLSKCNTQHKAHRKNRRRLAPKETTGSPEGRGDIRKELRPMSDYELIMIILAIAGLIVDVLVLTTRTKK